MHAKDIIQQAHKNVAKWGDQNFETLALAMAEESGELAQAVLQFRHKEGAVERIRQEAIDCGALALQVLRHFPTETPSRVLYVDPQGEHILVALPKEDGTVDRVLAVADFDTLHRSIAATEANLFGAKLEVRIDTGFRTGECRMQAERFGWIEDNTFDVRAMLREGRAPARPEPVKPELKAVDYKPAHGGRPSPAFLMPELALNDFLRTA